MADLTQFVAIRLVLPGWPTSVIGIPPMIDSIGLAGFETTSSGTSSFSANGTVQIIEEIAMDLPLIPGLSFVLLNHSGFTEISFEIDYLPDYFSVALTSISAGIRFQTGLLKRMEAVGDSFVEASPDPVTGEPQPVEISMEGASIAVNSNGEFTFTFADEFTALTIQPFMIGNSGVVVSITKLQVILSEGAAEQALPETLPADSRGVYLEEATIYLPEGLSDILPQSIRFTDAFIGSGGFSGSVFLDLSDDVLDYDEATAKTFLGFGFTFLSIEVGFLQNTLTKFSIVGFLKIPFFDEAVKVEVGLTNDGDVTIGISDADGLFTLTKDGIISIEVTSLEFIKEDNVYSIKLSGNITPLLAGLAWPSFELKGLTISSDGTVKIEGGWIELPELKVLDFHGFKIEIAALGFGSDEEGGILYKWVGFSGGIQIINELPLRGGVEGLKVMWADGGLVKLKIGGVYLSFEIKDVLTFDGAVYFIDEPAAEGQEEIKEFRGGVALNLIPLNFGLDAQFITGRTPDYNYFYIFVDIQLPVGIPLGPPVLGLFGLAGLYGHNMTVDYGRLIQYEDVVNRPNLTDVGNWYNEKGAMAFGAGLTVGTFPDVMFTVKAKALFVILIPGPILLIEGHAGILSTGENFILRVLAVLDVAAGTFLMNISAMYEFPKDSGELLNVFGSAEAFFSAGDPDSWHLYLGENEPESKRIRADILNFFTAQTYLMVDSKGLLMGAWIGYGLDKKYGILRVVLEAWLSGELGVSLMPLQAKGSITLYGNAELSASIVSLGISVEANVTAEAPKPLYIEASLKVQLKTPLGNPKATIKLKWEIEGKPPYSLPLSVSLGVEHRKVTKNWDVPKWSDYDLDNDGQYSGVKISGVPLPKIPVVPPDVYLVLNFDKPVQDVGLVGNNPAPSPPYEKVGNYEFAYALNSVLLEYRDSWTETVDDGQWNDYEDFAENEVEDGETSYSLSGTWQAVPNTEEIVNTKLVLNASTPFEISRVLEEAETWFGLIDIFHPEYPCQGEALEKELCADFEGRDFGNYYSILVQDGFIFTSAFPMNIHPHHAVWLGTEKAMNNADSYETIECLNIKAQEPTHAINLKIIAQVLITAGVGYDSSLQLTNAHSTGNIELYIDQSLAGPNQFSAFIHFPEASFENTPYEVWITCAMHDAIPGGALFYAFDAADNVLDTVEPNQNSPVNNVAIYKLKSATAPIKKISVLGYGIRIIEICYRKYHRVESSTILATMPEEMVKSEIYFSKGSAGTIYLYNRENAEIQQVPFNIPDDRPDVNMEPVLVQVEANTFRSFLVTGQYKLIRVCGVTEEAHETFVHNSGLNTHLQTSLEEHWGRHTAQILHPNKYYRLQINTTASRRKVGSSWEDELFTEYLYFKTGNPPGPSAPTQTEVAESDRYDLEGPLSGLSSYVEYTIPAGANAGEPQPFIYRSYDIGIVYNDSYIDQMYQMAGLPLSIRLLDNNYLPVLNADGDELELPNLWGDNPELSQTREEEHYQDILDESGCIAIATSVTVESNKELIASSRDLLLLPQIQYRAQLNAGELVVYEFAFLTSRYANFLHHVHSFADIVWNHFDLLGNPDYEIDRAVLEELLTGTEEEYVAFEQLMILFDLAPRSLPERLEITLLNDKNGTCGFLLETPEPFDPQRCEWSLQFANKADPVEEFYSTVKITGGSVTGTIARLDNTQVFSNQWVDILMLQSTDLSDFTIDYRAVASTEEEYVVYYHFGTGSTYPAGTLVRIYSGAAPASTPEPIEHTYLYANHSSETLSSSGTFIRIKNAESQVLHTRAIYSEAAFDELTTTFYQNEDGTRLFLFSESGTKPYSELQDGIYQLQAAYKRDIGADGPVLKRFGFSNTEEAALVFSLPVQNL
jgi:hypothetical protein